MSRYLVRVINFSANSPSQNCGLCGRKSPCIFWSSDFLLCFAFRLLFFLLALNVDLSSVAKSCLTFGFFHTVCFKQAAAYLAFPPWPPPCLWCWGISAHLTLVFTPACENRSGFPFVKYRGDIRTLSERRIRPWGFPKWLLAQAFPASLSVAASQDEAAGSLQCAPNAGLCCLQCCSLLLYCQFHRLL